MFINKLHNIYLWLVLYLYCLWKLRCYMYVIGLVLLTLILNPFCQMSFYNLKRHDIKTFALISCAFTVLGIYRQLKTYNACSTLTVPSLSLMHQITHSYYNLHAYMVSCHLFKCNIWFDGLHVTFVRVLMWLCDN